MKIARLHCAALAIGFMIGSCGPAPGGRAEAQQTLPRAGAYRLDPRHAAVYFRVNHMGFSRTVGRFNQVQASLTLDPQAPERSTLTALVATASIDSGLRDFDEFLRGPRFLNASANPDIRFECRSVEPTGDRTARITGDLTMNGRTHPVVLDVVLNGAGTHPFDGRFMAGFSATGRLSRAQWGLDAFSAQVANEVEVLIEAEFAHS